MKKCVILVLTLMLVLVTTAALNANPNKKITITILYDNYLHTEGTQNHWGFACLVEGTEKNILFDTGTKPEVLFHNMKKLNVNPNDAELVVLSHEHQDHTGGLWAFLEKNSKVTVYFPHSFPGDFTQDVEKNKAKAITVNQPLEVCKNAFLTGEMGNELIEQSLILDTDKGLILITGCSHPGIVSIVKKTMEIRKKKVFMALGGFHLWGKPENELKKIIAQLKELGVVKVGATHCTGDMAIKLFKEAYGENYINMGVGKVLKF